MSTSLGEPLPTAGCDGSAGGDEVDYRAVFPAAPAAVPAVRGYVRAVAGDCCARLDEVELIAPELASCAVRQTPGGVFTVRVWREQGWLRVEVATAGSGWWPAGEGEDAAAYGYGLAIVAGLGDRFGHDSLAGGAAVLWAEVRA